MAPVADGFWPLAPADAGQPPLFLASMHCFRSILGPGLKSYLGIIFFLLALGINLASTYCASILFVDSKITEPIHFVGVLCSVHNYLECSVIK